MVRREEIRAMQDAWRAYLDLALGLTETSRKRATKVVKKVVGRGGVTAEQLQSMAEELVTTSVANREALTRLVRSELERALSRVGLATMDEVNALNARVLELEKQLAEARAGDSGAPPVAAAPVRRVAKRALAPVDSTPVVPAPVTPAPATSAPPEALTERVPAAPAVKKVAARKAPAKKVAASAAPVKKAAVAKKTAAKRAPARKATEQP
jgi:polyhydroxyalkanoate synthesis regulator phasin